MCERSYVVNKRTRAHMHTRASACSAQHIPIINIERDIHTLITNLLKEIARKSDHGSRECITRK